MKPSEFTEIMAFLSASVGKPLLKETTQAYFDLLGYLPAVVFRDAARKAALANEYPTLPPVGVLYRLANEIMAGEHMTAEEKCAKDNERTDRTLHPEKYS